jgi:hypothetical protein
MLPPFCYALMLLLALPLLGRADGCAFGKGFTPQLRETHQLAVIILTQTSADVSMFIAIEGIPAGQELTYILPFWYRPEGFSLMEEDAQTFRTERVAPAHAKIQRVQRITSRRGSNALLLSAPSLGFGGLSALLVDQWLGPARVKGRGDAGATPLAPYATSETPHARAELYRIGQDDLQRLIRQSGLPDEYRKPLEKYRTPYFAVMRLKGVASPKPQTAMSGRGVRYHFTHRLTDGRYVYPLGTGAAWPQPIPLTEVYLTCPDELAMEVTAPQEEESVPWYRYLGLADSHAMYLTLSPEDRKKFYSEQDLADFLAPKTASLLESMPTRTPAWHIAYFQSNPAVDIRVRVHPQTAPWRLGIAEVFTIPHVPLAVCLLLYLLAWLATGRLVIYRRWQRAGRPGSFGRHCLTTFGTIQLVAPLMAYGGIAVAFGTYQAVDYLWKPHSYNNSAWIGIPILLVIAGLIIAVAVRYARTAAPDWRKWLALRAWVWSCLLFTGMAGLLYGLLYWCETL